MKVFLSLLFFISASLGVAQSPKKLYRQFKKCEGAESIFVPRFLIHVAGSMAAQAAEDEDDRKAARLIKHINAVRVLNLSDCNNQAIEAFQKAVKKLDMKGYETLVAVKDAAESTHILTKMKKNRIRELVILNTDPSDAKMVLLRCNISPELVGELAKEVQTMKRKASH